MTKNKVLLLYKHTKHRCNISYLYGLLQSVMLRSLEEVHELMGGETAQ